MLDASGNELSGRGVGARVSAEQYARDVIALKALLKELYRDSSTKPILVAPGGFFEQQWYAQLLQDSGSGVVNALTHHVYNLGGGECRKKLTNQTVKAIYNWCFKILTIVYNHFDSVCR